MPSRQEKLLEALYVVLQSPIQHGGVVLHRHPGLVACQHLLEQPGDNVEHLDGPLEEELDIGPQQGYFELVVDGGLAPDYELDCVFDVLAEVPDDLDHGATGCRIRDAPRINVEGVLEHPEFLRVFPQESPDRFDGGIADVVLARHINDDIVEGLHNNLAFT